VWFETLYKDPNDKTDKTLFALYHNENYPATLPFDSLTGVGYIDRNWPQGLKGPETKTAVCRIGIMKSVDGGNSWVDKGILIQDYQPRLILKPHNTGINFAGGVGDPSAIANGDYLYVFFGEYSYPKITILPLMIQRLNGVVSALVWHVFFYLILIILSARQKDGMAKDSMLLTLAPANRLNLYKFHLYKEADQPRLLLQNIIGVLQ
jgi:hypothetical protein